MQKYKNVIFLGNKNGENFFFLIQMFYNPLGYLASIMLLFS